ncbi:PREDICTED: natural killer cell receptor 2B4-like, partial [Buceros rhinoceros silvestris]|uniref:natural killer cell receptor 2B4-like n=1 Tax=Buceros rhinoceros silvestris TaxID=175836 RepID=UPI0005281A22
MHRHGGPRCPPVLLVLLCLELLGMAGGQGPLECREQAVSADGMLELLLEKPPQGWEKVSWRVELVAGSRKERIMTAEKNKDPQYTNGSFSGRARFQEENLSLSISPIRPADSGVYRAEFEGSSGNLSARCFHVKVWEPIHNVSLETRVLHWEQGWCNVSLLCTVPGASNISYNLSCPGGVQEPQPRLQMQVHGDATFNICHCTASNPVSRSTASTDVTESCRAAVPGPFGMALWWAVAAISGLALAITIALVTCYWRRKRRKDPLGGHVEQTLTVYEEVGKARTGQSPNGTSEATVEGNTIYAIVSARTQGRRVPEEPKSCTIYSEIQTARKVRLPLCDAASRSAPQPQSLRRSRLDPALTSTVYLEVTGTRS